MGFLKNYVANMGQIAKKLRKSSIYGTALKLCSLLVTLPIATPEIQKQKVNPRIINPNRSIVVKATNMNSTEDIDRQLDELIEKEGSQYRCKPCGKMSSRKYHAYEHAETHMEGLSFNCQMCDKTFRSRSSYRKHITRCPLRNNDIN